MKIALTYILLLSTIFCASAKNTSVEISGLNILQNGDSIDIGFKVDAGRKAAKRNYTTILTPTLISETSTVELQRIVIIGKGVELSDKRNGGANWAMPYGDAMKVENGSSATYKTSVPYARFSEKTKLIINGESVGCCSAQELDCLLLAQGVERVEKRKITEQEIVALPPILTTGDSLAQKYKFVAPLDDFENQSEIEREQYIADNRDGSLTVYFHVAKSNIDPSLKDNYITLNKIVEVIRQLEQSDDSEIAHIVIAGFASPEGSLQLNTKLGRSRASSLKQYLVSQTGIQPGLVDIHNGSIDWVGLRTLVISSDMPEKDEVINLIDNTPIWDSQKNTGRHIQLMKLKGGDTYKYMLKNIFPELRSATYIGVYYENR